MTDAVQSGVEFAVRGEPGQEYDAGYSDVVTKIATEDMPFGVFATFKTAGSCTLPAASGDVTHAGGWGLVLRDRSKPSGEGYKAGDAVRLLVRGRAFVLNEVSISHGAAVFARHVAGEGEQLGAFRHDNDGGSDATAVPGARWFQGGSAGQAVIEIGYGGSAGPPGATGATGATGPTGPTGPTGA